MARIDLLALDIDGTLVAEGNHVTPRTREALHRAHAAGVTVAIATGRRHRTAKVVLDVVGLPSPLVCLGGALVKDADDATVHASPFAPEDFVRVSACIRASGHTPVGQRDSATHGAADFVIDEGSSWNEPTRSYYQRNEEHAEAFDFAAGPRDDILVVGTFGGLADLEGLESRLEAEAPGRFVVNVFPTGDGSSFYGEVIPSDVSKWVGLTRLARLLGIADDAICAVGDQRNDLPMIRAAALGVAMGNAIDAVKQEADRVVGRNDEDGIVEVVELVLASR